MSLRPYPINFQADEVNASFALRDFCGEPAQVPNRLSDRRAEREFCTAWFSAVSLRKYPINFETDEPNASLALRGFLRRDCACIDRFLGRGAECDFCVIYFFADFLTDKPTAIFALWPFWGQGYACVCAILGGRAKHIRLLTALLLARRVRLLSVAFSSFAAFGGRGERELRTA